MSVSVADRVGVQSPYEIVAHSSLLPTLSQKKATSVGHP